MNLLSKKLLIILAVSILSQKVMSSEYRAAAFAVGSGMLAYGSKFVFENLARISRKCMNEIGFKYHNGYGECAEINNISSNGVSYSTVAMYASCGISCALVTYGLVKRYTLVSRKKLAALASAKEDLESGRSKSN